MKLAQAHRCGSVDLPELAQKLANAGVPALGQVGLKQRDGIPVNVSIIPGREHDDSTFRRECFHFLGRDRGDAIPKDLGDLPFVPSDQQRLPHFCETHLRFLGTWAHAIQLDRFDRCSFGEWTTRPVRRS